MAVIIITIMLAAGLTNAGMAVIVDKLLFCCFMYGWQGNYWWRFLQIKYYAAAS
jgi:hypothetical protein